MNAWQMDFKVTWHPCLSIGIVDTTVWWKDFKVNEILDINVWQIDFKQIVGN